MVCSSAVRPSLLPTVLVLVLLPPARLAVRVTYHDSEFQPQVHEKAAEAVRAPHELDRLPAWPVERVSAASVLQSHEEFCRSYEAAKRNKHNTLRRRSRFAMKIGKGAKERREKRRVCSSLAQAKAAAKDPGPRGSANEDNPWEMTVWDKLCLQGGWILQFVGVLLVLLLFSEFSHHVGKIPEPKTVRPLSDAAHREAEDQASPSLTMYMLYGLIWGEGRSGKLVNAGIIILSVLNFFFYSWATELRFPEREEEGNEFLGWDLDAVKVNRILETCSLIVFLPMTVIRILTIQCHPAWKPLGSSAPWRYAVSDVYIIAEMLALAVALVDIPRYILYGTHDHLNLLFLFFIRSFDMLERTTGGKLGIRRLRHMVMDDGKLLITAMVIGLVVWLVMSGLYFAANRRNDANDALWKVATYDGKPWRKFESIPSTMWFVLINLLKEHPLADAFETTSQRVWVCVVCIFAMPLFAVPASILQISLFKAEEQEADEQEALAASAAGDAPALRPEVQLLIEENPEPPPSFRAGVATGLLIFGSLFTYFYYTAQNTDHAFCFGIPVRVTNTMWASVDFGISLVFALEWGYRLLTQGSYAFSGRGIIDLVAWVPGILHLTLQWKADLLMSTWWSAASVLRVLKLERFLHSWHDIIEIVWFRKEVLGATFLLSMLLWMLCSVLIYRTEMSNPDPDMRKEFGSVMRSLWAELINLHGEWPWADYTTSGKGLGTFIGLFSIMLFCVPISIFSDSFQSKIHEEVETFPEEFDRRPWFQRCRPEGRGPQQKMYDSFYSHLHDVSMTPMGWLRNTNLILAFMLVGATTVVSCMGTLDESYFGDAKGLVWWLFYMTDMVATLFFIYEYTARTFATGGRHPFSIIGACDILSLAGFIVTLNVEWRDAAFHPEYKKRDFLHLSDDIVVPLRLLRMFSLESYFAALHVLRNVFHLYRWPLMRAGYSLASTWFIHATLLYQFEQEVLAEHGKTHDAVGTEPGGKGDDGEITMSYRYRSILSALQYSIVHLFGDYPETEYYFESKIVHFIGIMGGMAIIATFCGVFSGCIINYLEDDRIQEQKYDLLRRCMMFMNSVRKFQRAFRRRQARRATQPTPAVQLPSWKRWARTIAFERTPEGQGIMLFFNATLVVSIISTMVASLPESERYAPVEYACLLVAAVSTVVFIVEYVIRVVACPERATEFFRILDLVCCFPGFIKLGVFICYGRNGAPYLEACVEALSMMRAARILEFSVFAREVNVMSRAFRDAMLKLVIPAYLAVSVWIVTSALFMWMENYFSDEKSNVADSMPSVPDAMYWCCIFLTGEWANVDFTFAGSRLCIFYVLFGISMFSIPVGIIVEAVQTNVLKQAEEVKQIQMLMSMSSKGAKEAAGSEAEEVTTFTDVIRRASVVDSKRRATMRVKAERRQSLVGKAAGMRASRASIAARASMAGISLPVESDAPRFSGSAEASTD